VLLNLSNEEYDVHELMEKREVLINVSQPQYQVK
jgi:hypothetical protein